MDTARHGQPSQNHFYEYLIDIFSFFYRNHGIDEHDVWK